MRNLNKIIFKNCIRKINTKINHTLNIHTLVLLATKKLAYFPLIIELGLIFHLKNKINKFGKNYQTIKNYLLHIMLTKKKIINKIMGFFNIFNQLEIVVKLKIAKNPTL